MCLGEGDETPLLTRNGKIVNPQLLAMLTSYSLHVRTKSRVGLE